MHSATRTVISLYLTELDHTRPVTPTDAAHAARHAELLLEGIRRPMATTYLVDAAHNLRTDPATHHARLAWARALATDLTDRP
ncbi:hypothetical protein [Streptomyces javensis]|uniref:Uncharacterized protein n=1 Tax=Streptomyces javensis TaxID=114698 RepID=A0ABS0RR21_9ACTN|nr:hypothetical protein [Streptomyces javensis]MBI0319907.1 hypothetical protein [Streptomyces javensis]